MPLQDAAPAELPALLVSPPWLDPPKPQPLPIVERLQPLPFAPRVRMNEREREHYLPPFQTLSDLRGFNLVPKHLEPGTPEMEAFVLARIEKGTRYGASYLDLLTEPAARAYFERKGIDALLPDTYDVRHLLARFGAWALPILQKSETGAAALVDMVESTAIADKLVKPATRGRKAEREEAQKYFTRYPEVAAVVLLPLALAKKTQKGAVPLLQLVAREDLATVQEVARRYGPAVEAALPALLAHEGPPPKVPMLPAWVDPAQLPAIEVSTTPGKRFPDSAVLHLCTMLAMASGNEWPEAIGWLRDVRPAGTRASLAAFSWALFQTWLAQGAAPDASFAMRALGWFGDDAAARELAALVRQWPRESAYSRALKGIDVLAAMDTDAAIAEIDALADRGAYKSSGSTAQHADTTLAKIAAHRGISRDDLADQVVPTSPLGPDGARRLTTHQTRRLEAAMLSGRRWTAARFLTRIAGHPLLAQLARRLVWGIFAEDRLERGFRIAEDGSFADVDDKTLALPESAVIGLPHRLDLTDAEAARWGDLLSDYEIIQPFPQIGREVYRITAAEVPTTSLARVTGVVPTAALVGLASKGWGRAVEDGGSVQELRRELHGGLEATLEFSPGYYVASLSSSEPTQAISPVTVRDRGKPVPLGDLPPIVFSELVRELMALRP